MFPQFYIIKVYIEITTLASLYKTSLVPRLSNYCVGEPGYEANIRRDPKKKNFFFC